MQNLSEHFAYDDAVKTPRLRLFVILFIAFVMIWRAVVAYDMPQFSDDWAGVLSQTMSVLRGDLLSAPFGYTYLDPPYQFGYVYAVVTAPLYAVFTSDKYAPYIVAYILIFILGGVLYQLFKKVKLPFMVQALAFLGLFTNPYLMGREEVLGVILMCASVLFLLDWKKEPVKPYLWGGAFFLAMTGLVHPLYGVIGTVIVVFIAHNNRVGFVHLVRLGLMVLGVLIVTYGPIILLDPQNWIDSYTVYFGRDERATIFDVSFFIKAVQLSLPLFALYGLALLAAKWGVADKVSWSALLRYDLIPFTILVILIIPFERSYYFPMMFPFLLWRICVLPKFHMPLLALVPLLLIAPLFTNYLPSIQQIENRAYRNAIHEIFEIAAQYEDIAAERRVWVDSRAAMPVIREEYSRHFVDWALAPNTEIQPGEVILYSPADRIELLEDYFIYEGLVICELIAPIEGLVSFDSLFRERSDPLGLYQVTRADETSLVMDVDPAQCEAVSFDN